jgi:hypothetical protein
MNLRFVLRGSLLALAAVFVGLIAVLLLIEWRHQEAQPLPPVVPPVQ